VIAAVDPFAVDPFDGGAVARGALVGVLATATTDRPHLPGSHTGRARIETAVDATPSNEESQR
jgi:hypothetical protein